jgi:hypothetical protein
MTAIRWNNAIRATRVLRDSERIVGHTEVRAEQCVVQEVLIHLPHQGVCGQHGTEEQRVTSGGLTESPGGTAPLFSPRSHTMAYAPTIATLKRRF